MESILLLQEQEQEQELEDISVLYHHRLLALVKLKGCFRKDLVNLNVSTT